MKAAKPYVCVRVTDMRGIDLHTFRFDYDLTFAALLMNADGTIYHTFAGRDAHDAESHLSVDSMVATLKHGLRAHMAHTPVRREPPEPPEVIEKIFDGKPPKNCFHCHNVHDTRFRRAGPEREREHYWPWPDPIQIGVALDTAHPPRLVSVESGSAAARAGLRKGDALLTANSREVFTFGDFQRTLDEIPYGGGTLELTLRRGEKEIRKRIALGKDWRVASLDTYAWRSMVWNRWPKPGFGGPPLRKGEKRKLGLPEDGFAFRVRYLVTWGRFPQTGRRAARAGIRRGDVVFATNGKTDFRDIKQWHTWHRLERKLGDTVTYDVLRKGRKHKVRLKLER